MHRSRTAFPKPKDLAPVAYATLRLPPGVLPGFRWRSLVVVSYWPFAPYSSCRRAPVAAVLERSIRRLELRVTGTYEPDDPAPVIRLAERPVLTIDAPNPDNFENPIATADTDGDGRPEVGMTLRRRPEADQR